jgi:hypothetical protein
MEPAYNEKALVLGDYLIIADLHIGLERELSKNGLHVPSQLRKMEARIIELLRNTGKEKLILLGDLKHNIPMVSWQEYNEIPGFIERLAQYAEVALVKGNHDGSIEKIVPDLKVQKELTVNGKALLLHGHTKPSNLDYDCIIIAHNHPCIEFRGEFGYGITESAWIRTNFKKEYLGTIDIQKNPEIIIMPAFNDLIYGMPFNTRKSNELLGPLFRKGLVELGNARAFLLDSTFLGRIKDLRGERVEKPA